MGEDGRWDVSKTGVLRLHGVCADYNARHKVRGNRVIAAPLGRVVFYWYRDPTSGGGEVDSLPRGASHNQIRGDLRVRRRVDIFREKDLGDNPLVGARVSEALKGNAFAVRDEPGDDPPPMIYKKK